MSKPIKLKNLLEDKKQKLNEGIISDLFCKYCFSPPKRMLKKYQKNCMEMLILQIWHLK